MTEMINVVKSLTPVLQNIYTFFLTGCSYWLIGKAGPIRKKIVCRMMGCTEESFDRIAYKDATWQRWVNQDKCMIGRHRNFHNGAGGIYNCIAIMSYYAVCRDAVSFREIEEVEEDLIKY